MRLVVSVCFLVSQFAFFQPQENQTQQDRSATQATNVPRIMVNGDVMKKQLVHKINPNYPTEARRQRIAGTVILHVVIGVDGNVRQTEYVSGPDIFVKPTIDAVRQWKYKPTTESGKSVEVDTTVKMVFSAIY
jgi:periplasmic protein TonB